MTDNLIIILLAVLVIQNTRYGVALGNKFANLLSEIRHKRNKK